MNEQTAKYEDYKTDKPIRKHIVLTAKKTSTLNSGKFVIAVEA
jgi:hypothetical protein